MWEGELLGRERVKSRSNIFDSNSVLHLKYDFVR